MAVEGIVTGVDIKRVYRKAEALADDLRTKIVAGRYQPGERLPSRMVMRDEYKVSSVTIQKALDQLSREGFVATKDRSGTFVAKLTPHQTHYALLLAFQKEHAEQNSFNRALALAAKRFNRDFVLDLHYGFYGARGVDRYQNLVEDVQKHRIAGILFASPPFILIGTPLLEAPGIPRSAFMSPVDSLADLPAVSVDMEQFLAKATGFIGERQCRRVAVIASSRQAAGYISRIQAAFAAAEIQVVPKWFQGSDITAPCCTRSLTQLIMSGRVEDRPDCLVITDDNLLPPASEALRDMGIIPPHNIQLLAHCNFPWPTPSAVPAVRLGYSMTECIQAMMQQIHNQQNRRNPQMHIQIPAYFDHEFSENQPQEK